MGAGMNATHMNARSDVAQGTPSPWYIYGANTATISCTFTDEADSLYLRGNTAAAIDRIKVLTASALLL